MIKINDNNIYVGYIKQLLSSFNLPQCPIGVRVYEQPTHYIDKEFLYYYKGGNSTLVSAYKENDYIENITKKLEIRNNIYDSYTHEYLGDYLRYVRDYKGLDLMSMYNCFSNASMVNTKFSVNDSEFDSNSDLYTIFVVPVRYNQKYTITMDWHGTIEMCCGYYDNGNLATSSLNSNIDIQAVTYHKESGLRFSHPIVYDKLVDNSGFINDYACEKDFKLFLKIPTVCKSSIVILEGDYAENASLFMQKREIIISKEDNQYLNEELNYLSKPQLLSMNTQKVCLLADRLVEYLSKNVITPIDPVIDNIRRLQTKLKQEYNIPYDFYGIWDNRLRNFIYAYINDNGLFNRYCDLLAYLDKDIERNDAGDNKGLDIEYIITKEEDASGKEITTIKENDVWQTQ